ncbi:hypothetical protein GC194_06110 [bacterium]|nr:hypothetical protein [bacterium]
MRIYSLALALVLFLASCGNDDAYKAEVANLQNELKTMQEQLNLLQTEKEEEAKTQLDATGIAIVDMEKLLSEYKGYQAAERTYKAIITRYSNELQQMQKEFEQRYALIEKDAATFGEDFVKDDLVELQNFRDEIYKKDQELTEKSAQQENDMLKEVLKKINAHSKVYAQENGYQMILFTSVENGIFYANDQINITDEYIDNINAAYEAEKK